MLSRRQPRRQEIRMVDIVVVGAGTMGAGIAESAALAGLSVMMVDVREEALDLGRKTIEKDLKRRVKKGRLRKRSVGLHSDVSRRPPPWKLAPVRRWSSRP